MASYRSNPPTSSGSEQFPMLGERCFGMLQVLLPQFTLTKEAEGLVLELEVHDQLESLADSGDMRAFLERMANAGAGPRHELERQLETFHGDDRIRSYCFKTADFPLRHGNGGALPVVRIDSTDYFSLFYRDAFPVGWNLANGASDSEAEMGDPGRIVQREFGEELLIVDHNQRCLYTFDGDPGKVLPGVQAVTLQKWKERRPDQNLEGYQRSPLPLKWIAGPDRVSARIRGTLHTSSGYFVNITPEDNAIEFDRIALIHLHGDPVFFDGELSKRRSLNRPIGLFEVGRFAEELGKGSHSLFPDLLFHDMAQHPAASLEAVVEAFRTAMPRDARDSAAFERAVAEGRQFDLCPITRAMIPRYHDWLNRQGQPPPLDGIAQPVRDRTDTCDIFISYRSADQSVAQWLHQFLEKRGHEGRVFCSAETLPRLGESDYARAIDAALASATCLIVVGTCAEYFDSGWVDYEWKSFLNEIRSRRKPHGQVFVFAGGVEVGQLPFALRSQQMVPWSPTSPHDSFEALYRFIEAALQTASKAFAR